MIRNCTFENITLNPNQPLYAAGQVLDLHFDTQKSTGNSPILSNLIKFIFYDVRKHYQNTNGYNGEPTREYNIFLDNHEFAGGYGSQYGVNPISTGFQSWVNSTSPTKTRAQYITFRSYDLLQQNPQYFTEENLNISIYIYGGKTKTDGKKSTIDLSEYSADYRFIDLSGGASNITGVNF